MLPERLPFKNWPEYKVDEFSADPSTPESNDWQLYFKAGGLYHIDDAGTVTGPLSSATGNVTKVGTPANDQVGVWTGNGTIEGTADLTFASNLLTVTKTAIGVSQGDYGLKLINTTAAAAGAQQYSPPSQWIGQGWKTDATAESQAVAFRCFARPIQGAAAPTGGLDFQASINGGAYSDLMTLLSGGNFGLGITTPTSPFHVVKSQALGVCTKIVVTQTQPNPGDTDDAAMNVLYTLSANSATNELVARVFKLDLYNALIGGGEFEHCRVFNLVTNTAANTTTGNLASIYLEAGAQNGTVTTGYGVYISSIQGTAKWGIHDLSGGNWYTSGVIGVLTQTPDGAFAINQGTGTAWADLWDTYSCAAIKEDIVKVDGGYLEKLRNVPTYSYRMIPDVSADELREAAINHFGPEKWQAEFGGEIIEDENGGERLEDDQYRGGKLQGIADPELLTFVDSTADKLRKERRKLPRWQRKHLGLVADYPELEANWPEAVGYGNDGEILGTNLAGYIGVLHATMREMLGVIDDQQTRIEVLETA